MKGRGQVGTNGRLRGYMTPMIDIVFLLLIFFLLSPSDDPGQAYLTTNLPNLGQSGLPGDEIYRAVEIELQVPEANTRDVVIVLKDGRCFGRNFEGLMAALADMRARGLPADHPVLIRPWMACRHQWVVRAFDTAVAARFENVHFAVPYL